jgi:hypothetical protein
MKLTDNNRTGHQSIKPRPKFRVATSNMEHENWMCNISQVTTTTYYSKGRG